MKNKNGNATLKILMIHNYYQQRGGEDVSTDSEVTMLRKAGHVVEFYSLHNDKIKNMNPLRVAFRTLWSFEAYSKVRSILKEDSFHIVHIQNTFPLISPSVYYAAKRCSVPVVQSVRNFRFFCLNGFFHDGVSACEKCFHKNVSWPGIARRCYRKSLSGSVVSAGLKMIHGVILQTWKKQASGYIALSEFVREKLIEGGFDRSKIYVKPNFVSLVGFDRKQAIGRDYFIFVGRLSPEKGILTMLDAFAKLDDPSVELLILGDGPMMQELIDRKVARVQFLGRKSPDEVLGLIANAVTLIFPSECYETFGRVAIEAYAVGTPVIGSDIGAISELIIDGETGFLFEAGNARSLMEAIKKVRMGNFESRCRDVFNGRYTVDENRSQLEGIYKKVIKRQGL